LHEINSVNFCQIGNSVSPVIIKNIKDELIRQKFILSQPFSYYLMSIVSKFTNWRCWDVFFALVDLSCKLLVCPRIWEETRSDIPSHLGVKALRFLCARRDCMLVALEWFAALKLYRFLV